MIPLPPEAFLRIAVELELSAGREGWDSMPPVAGVVFARAREDDVVGAAVPMPVQPLDLSDDLIEGLNEIVEALRSCRVAGEWPRRRRRLCGVWLVWETWAHASRDVEWGKIADTPGALELRHAAVLDFSGRLHLVYRIRGQGTFGGSLWPGDPNVPLYNPGLIPALRELALEHAMLVKEDASDVAMIAKWRDAVDA